jgi:UDP-2-acetamido-3-amino-2,3-dideoxy-glucuronate N-acetyltransferase
MSLVSFVDLPDLGDDRGGLAVVESKKTFPFEIKRIYSIYGTKQGVARGFHAHKKLHQVAFCVSGSCEMLLDNGYIKETIKLNSPLRGVEIPPLVWHEMHNFSDDCVLMVLASEYYDEADYIRDYKKFLKGISI